MATSPAFVFAIDLDGVTLWYVKALKAVVEEEFGLEPGSLTYGHDWWFTEWGITKDNFLHFHNELAVNRRGLRTLEPIEGAVEALWRLSDAGVWNRILTHRLILPGHHHTLAGDTVYSLEANNIPYRDLCFMEAKADLGAHIYVDDAPHNVEALQDVGKEVIIFDQPYNRHVEGLRAKGWGEVEAIVMDRFEAWKSSEAYV